MKNYISEKEFTTHYLEQGTTTVDFHFAPPDNPEGSGAEMLNAQYIVEARRSLNRKIVLPICFTFCDIIFHKKSKSKMNPTKLL